MLHETLAQYLARVEQAILRCRNAYVERYTEEILTPQRVNLRIRVRFEQGHLLEINEAVVVVEGSLVPLDYRYHCQDVHNHVIFRYDSTPHFPGLPNFPHHKHLSNMTSPCTKCINRLNNKARVVDPLGCHASSRLRGQQTYAHCTLGTHITT